jgi:hypothetical protein
MAVADREITEKEFQEIVDRLKKRYQVREKSYEGRDLKKTAIVSGKQLIMRPMYQLALKKGAGGYVLQVANLKGYYWVVVLALVVMFMNLFTIVIGLAALVYQFLNDWGLRPELEKEIEAVVGPELE